MTKQLVAYFSASGVTAQVAAALAQAAGAELHEIRPTAPYTTADLDWTDKKSRSSLEMADRSARPEIADPAVDLGGYEVVYLGFPIWWYREPSIVDTFLEANDFTGTTIVLFATSGSSTSFGEAPARAAALTAPDTRIVEGPILASSMPHDTILTWYDSLEL